MENRFVIWSHLIIYLFCEFGFTADSWHSWGTHPEPSWIPGFTNTKMFTEAPSFLSNHISMEHHMSFCSQPYGAHYKLIILSNFTTGLSVIWSPFFTDTKFLIHSWALLQMHKKVENREAKGLFSVHLSCKTDFRFISQTAPRTLRGRYKESQACKLNPWTLRA